MNSHDLFLEWLLAASFRASLLALAVLALQTLLRRWLPARWRHALWLPVIFVLLAPGLPGSRFSIENRFRAAPTALRVEPASLALPEPQGPGSIASEPKRYKAGARPIFFAVWLAGACGAVFAGGIGYWQSLRRIARGRVKTVDRIVQSVASAAGQLGLKRSPKVIASSAIDSPAVMGLLRPVLLLPSNFPEGFTSREERLIILHELTHLKRRDLPLNWLLCALQALHWFNPLLWLAFARMRADRETACDADVLQAAPEDCRRLYGHALLKLQDAASGSRLSLAFVGIFERAGMRARIRAITVHRRTHPAWSGAAVFLIAALTLLGATRAQDAGAEKPKSSLPSEPVDQQEKSGYGRFISFKDGTLRLRGNYSGLVWHNVPEQTQVIIWDDAAQAYKPGGTAGVLSKVEAGSWISVGDRFAKIYVGARKGSTTGTFVSFKDERLLMLGKDLGPAYTKKYGNQLHMNKFADHVPVYESIDGGDFEYAGTPAEVLPKVKEGTVITLYAQGDDNFTRIEIGTPKKN